MRGLCLTLIWATVNHLPVSAQTADRSGTPQFTDYPVAEVFTGKPATPIVSTPAQRNYRARIRNGVLAGAGVWSGSWKNPVKGQGPNFAGHYFAVRWGCGSQCVMMAIVDARTGVIYDPPLASAGELNVPLDNLSEMEVDLRPDSSLLVLRNACRDFRNRGSCGIYYFEWKDKRFSLIKFVAVDPLKKLAEYGPERRAWLRRPR